MATSSSFEARQRLEAEVAEIKQREARGAQVPLSTADELRARRLAAENIISIADVIRPVIEGFAKKAGEVAEFSEKLRAHCNSLPKTYCDEHADTIIPVHWDNTFAASWKDGKPIVVLGLCPKCVEERKRILVNEKWRKAGVPERLLPATLGNFKIQGSEKREKALKKAKSQLQKGRGFLILRGTVGTGKSHLAAGIMKAMGDGIFITEADLIGELRQTYSDNSGQDKLVEKYRATKCLVLDELSVEVKGVDIAPLLYRILGYRYDRGLLTVLTSNDSFSDICAILGEKLVDRMKENYSIATCEWESYRRAQE